jgi:hypothetical protein
MHRGLQIRAGLDRVEASSCKVVGEGATARASDLSDGRWCYRSAARGEMMEGAGCGGAFVSCSHGCQTYTVAVLRRVEIKLQEHEALCRRMRLCTCHHRRPQ